MNPYANAPRLPEGEHISLDDIVTPASAPLEIEIGPGRGMFALERLVAMPEGRLVCFEIRRKWSQILDERIQARGWGSRARCLAEDARDALPRLGPDASVQTVFILFPDPWWKKRHSKRLVVGGGLLHDIARLLVDGGELFIQTDVEERAREYAADVGAVPEFEPAGDTPGNFVIESNPYLAKTNREKRADADGLPVVRMRWRRRPR